MELKSSLFALCNFFEQTVPRLPDSYEWKIPAIKGFSKSGYSDYESNIDLKRFLSTQWNSANNEERLKLARVIVSDWGGVRANKTSTLESYVNAILEMQPKTPLKGVASYSKIFSIARPEEYAIYDARVAACLNAVQINSGISSGIAFNYVPGRNNIVGDAKRQIGFAHDPRFSVRFLVENGWTRIKRDDSYAKYNELLSICLKHLPKCSRFELEMSLFSRAKNECLMAMN